MAETTKTPATEILYDSMTREITIVFRSGARVVPPLNDAVRLGDQLVNLMRPIWEIAQAL